MSGVRLAITAQLAREPRSCQPPVPHHGLRRDLKHLSSLVDAQASKEPQFDHFCAAGIDLVKALKGVIECAERRRSIRVRGGNLIHVNC
jgi:hypothetical protein